MKVFPLALAAMAGAGLLASCGGETATPPLTVQVQLDRHQVPAGTSIEGVAVLTNHTAKNLPLTTCPKDWIQVGLANGRIHFAPITTFDLCGVPHGHLTPGRHRVPIEVESLYSACSGSPSRGEPPCTPFGIPPLPAGRYKVVVVMRGLPSGTPAPTQDWVKVTAPVPSVPASVPHGTIVVSAPYCSSTRLGPPHVAVAIWKGRDLLGVTSGSGREPFTFRVVPGRYILRSSTKNQGEATVAIGSTAHLALVKRCGP